MAASLTSSVQRVANTLGLRQRARFAARLLVCGTLYLAGDVLHANSETPE